MTLVVDASVAVKWLVREHDTDAARQLFALPDPLIAPDWLIVEAANTFWRKVKAAELAEGNAKQNLNDLPEFFSRLYPSPGLVSGALAIAFHLRHPVYDCLYIELARQMGCRMVTADKELLKRVAGSEYADLVVDLGIYAMPESPT